MTLANPAKAASANYTTRSGCWASLEPMAWSHASVYPLMQRMRGGLGVGLMVRMGPVGSGGRRILGTDTPPLHRPPPKGAAQARPRPSGLRVYEPDAHGNQDPQPRNTLQLGLAPCPYLPRSCQLGSERQRKGARGRSGAWVCAHWGGRLRDREQEGKTPATGRSGEGTTIPRWRCGGGGI